MVLRPNNRSPSKLLIKLEIVK
jgi:hypothetical protein